MLDFPFAGVPTATMFRTLPSTLQSLARTSITFLPMLRLTVGASETAKGGPAVLGGTGEFPGAVPAGDLRSATTRLSASSGAGQQMSAISWDVSSSALGFGVRNLE